MLRFMAQPASTRGVVVNERIGAVLVFELIAEIAGVKR